MEKINWTDYFYYDETSPTCLRYRKEAVSSETRFKGDDEAGLPTKEGYMRVSIFKQKALVHTIIGDIFGLYRRDGQYIDHIDGNKANNTISNLRIVSKALNARNMNKRVTNTSGVTGVSFTTKGGKYLYCTAFWKDTNGKTFFSHFSVAKLGLLPAFRDAVICREQQIRKLNEIGAGYTDRHGKDSK